MGAALTGLLLHVVPEDPTVALPLLPEVQCPGAAAHPVAEDVNYDMSVNYDLNSVSFKHMNRDFIYFNIE